MTDIKRSERWGKGQLFAFSAFDGKTDFNHGLVLRSVAGACALELKKPASGGILLIDQAEPASCAISGDYFEMTTAQGVTRGVMPDAYHLLIEGSCRFLGLAPEYYIEHKNNLTLLGVKAFFKREWLDADIDALKAQRNQWFQALTPPADRNEISGALFKAFSQLKTQLNTPEGNIKHLWTTPNRWPHQKMWLWDSVFHALGMRHIDPATARESLAAVFDVQEDSGFIPHEANPNGKSDVTQPPVLAYGMKKIHELSPDIDFIREYFPKNAAFLKWIMANRDRDGAGLMEWWVVEHENCRCGESGMDNSPRFDNVLLLDATDFNAFLSRECRIMAEFAAMLKLKNEEDFWLTRHHHLNQLINEYMWSEKDKFYVDYDPVNKCQSPMLASSGFLPLICGAPSPEMAKALVAHLKNENTFYTPLRIPSISKSQPEFYGKDMWRGPVWININHQVIDGLIEYGFTEEANELIADTVAEMEKHYDKYGCFFEFYDDRQELDPPMLNRKGQCNPDLSPFHQVFMDYGWSATLYIDMIYGINRR